MRFMKFSRMGPVGAINMVFFDTTQNRQRIFTDRAETWYVGRMRNFRNPVKNFKSRRLSRPGLGAIFVKLSLFSLFATRCRYFQCVMSRNRVDDVV